MRKRKILTRIQFSWPVTLQSAQKKQDEQDRAG